MGLLVRVLVPSDPLSVRCLKLRSRSRLRETMMRNNGIWVCESDMKLSSLIDNGVDDIELFAIFFVGNATIVVSLGLRFKISHILFWVL